MLDHLPERDRDAVKRKLRQAWQETDYDIALEQLTALGSSSTAPTPAPPPPSERAWKRPSP